jgi:hypothetical protein
MFEHIRGVYPQAEEVVGGSWLYTLPSYRASFPPAFTADMKRLVPHGFEHMPDSVPGMSFGGDSLWGQFVNRRGAVREPAYSVFLERLGDAASLEALIDAFPSRPYQPRAPISVFYDWIAPARRDCSRPEYPCVQAGGSSDTVPVARRSVVGEWET